MTESWRRRTGLLLLLLAWHAGAEAADTRGVRELLAAGEWSAALAQARERFARAPDDPAARGELGAALLRAGRVSEAESLLGEAGPDSGDPLALVTLARLRAARGRHEEAVGLAAEAVTLAPEDAEILYWAAHAPRSRAQAVEWLEKYRELADERDADRSEAVRGTLELFRALGERQTWIAEQAPRTVDLGLQPIGSGGEIYGFVIEARLPGRKRPVRLLLDSGSPGLVLLERIAVKGHYDRLAEETSFGGGGSQRHRVTRGLLPAIEFGELRFRDALVTTTRYEIEPYGRYQGVIGLSVFDGYTLTIEPAERKLLLRLEDREAGAGSPYWDIAGQMLVEATVAGRPELFLFDTGASRTIVAEGLVARLESIREQGRTPLLGFGGAREGARAVGGIELGFQGLANEGEPLAATDLGLRSRLSGVEISGFLGLDLIGRHRIVVDTRSRTVRVD